LKNKKGGQIPSVLLSAPIDSTTKNGAQLYQTAIVDLSERKRAEEALRLSQERYRTLFDFVPIAVYTCDANGTIREYNKRAAELWGWEPGRNGQSPKFCGSYKIFHPDGRPMPHEKCPMARALRGQKLTPKDLEIVVERPNGTRRYVIPSPHVLLDDRGKIRGAINCLYDITERKQDEAAALRLAAIVQSSHDAIVAKDLNGIITDWNKSAERIFGYKPKEIIGKSILTLIPADRHDEETEILRRIRRGKSIEHYETVRRRKDGTLVDVSLTISPVKEPSGKIVGISKIARDITRQKNTERRLAEQARLLDLSSEAILVRDQYDRITYWNRGAQEIYGYSAEQALGKIVHELLKTRYSEPLGRINEKLERDGRWSGELVHRRKNGTQVIVMSNWVLDRDHRRKRSFILETNSDITARKTAEVALQRSKAMLEKLVRYRTKALRAANTELENEIRRRKGLEGEILAISDREQQRFGQELHDGLCQQLTAVSFMAQATALRLKHHRVIETKDIEKIARLISASVASARNIARDLHKEKVDAATFEVALRDLVSRKLWKTPCRLELKTDPNLQDDRVASELYRILREALINANKHARATQIVLEVRRDRGDLVCSVKDNGVGMSGKTETARGLGFHIMKYRAQSIGARLDLASPPTGGTRLAVYLPQLKNG
jgi:PAS domain S-box-containing protein